MYIYGHVEHALTYWQPCGSKGTVMSSQAGGPIDPRIFKMYLLGFVRCMYIYIYIHIYIYMYIYIWTCRAGIDILATMRI